MKAKIINFLGFLAGAISIFGILWAPGHLIFHDIPTAVRGYEEIAVEWEYEDDSMGIQTVKRATKTVKQKVTGGDVVGMILEDLMIGILSFGVQIPFWKDFLEIEEKRT